MINSCQYHDLSLPKDKFELNQALSLCFEFIDEEIAHLALKINEIINYTPVFNNLV